MRLSLISTPSRLSRPDSSPIMVLAASFGLTAAEDSAPTDHFIVVGQLGAGGEHAGIVGRQAVFAQQRCAFWSGSSGRLAHTVSI